MKTYENTKIDLGSALIGGFVSLKLTHQIDWSWWWVTAPIWVSVLIDIAHYIICPEKYREEKKNSSTE